MCLNWNFMFTSRISTHFAMKLLIFFFIYSAVLQISLCYDVELEGTIKLGPDLIKQLMKHNGINDEQKPMIVMKNGQKAEMDNNVEKQERPPVTIMRRSLNESVKVVPNNFLSPEIEDEEKIFLSVTETISNSGVQNLKNVVKYLSYKCDVKKDVNVTTREIIGNYVATLKEKAKEIKKIFLLSYDLDKEYALLNLVELSSILFYRMEKEILYEMLNATNKSLFDINTNSLSENIHSYYKSHRRNGMQIICEKYKKCREYPGFSDNLADLITAILKLPTTKIVSFFDTVKKIFMKEVKFIGKLLESEVLDEIIEKLRSSEVSKIRTTLDTLRSIIIARYKLIYSPNKEKLKKTKAARILLDIIDKSFYIDGQDLQSIEFDTIINLVEQWGIDQKSEAELAETLRNFLYHILNILKHQWGDGVANEINTLLEIILLGYAKDDFGEKYLINKGSLFVRNKLVHADVEVGVSDYANFPGI